MACHRLGLHYTVTPILTLFGLHMLLLTIILLVEHAFNYTDH